MSKFNPFYFKIVFQEWSLTYDPRVHAANANVLRSPENMTPSERRRFADAERRRLSELRSRRDH